MGRNSERTLLSAKLGLILRLSTLAGLAGLLVFVFHFGEDRFVYAAPALQETPGYDAPTEPGGGGDVGYDAPATETPPGNPTPTENAFPSPTAEPTDILTSTLPPDVFRTEDSEINNAITTPVITEAAGPTITPYYTATATRTPLRTPGALAAVEKKGGFSPDWGLFWIGFSIPVLGACGVVLYLLDRQPGLFKRRR